MSAAPLVVAAAVGTGFVVPRVLARARWTWRAPVLGLALWQALSLAFVVSLVISAYQVFVPDGSREAELLHVLHACASELGQVPTSVTNWTLLAAPLAVAAWPTGWIAARILRAYRSRRRHAEQLAPTAKPDPRLGALVVDHHRAAVYCLPGLRPLIVVTTGAIGRLSAKQMSAVLAHERAHIRGRHHLLAAFGDGFALAFPRLPLARHLRDQTHLLMEMAADDQALQRHRALDLATAMYEVATAQAPSAALGAGSSCLLRVQRLTEPTSAPGPVARAGIAALTVLTPVLPLLLSCTTHPG